MTTKVDYKLLAKKIAKGEAKTPFRTGVTRDKSEAKRILLEKQKERLTATY